MRYDAYQCEKHWGRLMDGKFRIRYGDTEIEWDGDVEFLTTHLPKILEQLGKHSGSAKPSENFSTQKQHGTPVQIGTTGAIASKLAVKGGGDLLRAAMARLQIGGGQEIVSRSDVLKEMQTAKAFYKPSYGGNLSKIIASLMTQNKINEPSANNYSLTPSERAQLEQALS